MSERSRRQSALDYHAAYPPGKIEVISSKSVANQVDLSLAYSPGVAEPCKEIVAAQDNVYKYTAKGNLVGVITNGTAVLGLGDIGPHASKPVMEGKGVLFKRLAGIDVFDIEIDEPDPQKLVDIIKALAPTFGGINLEDIKAPESFFVEDALREQLDIPVMHDDQHGTAIISSTGMLNALELTHRKAEDLQLVVSGAGTSAISCVNLYVTLGVKRENIVMLDSRGVIRKDRPNLDAIKAKYATERDLHTLDDAMRGADMFLGLSRANVLSAENVLNMRENPIVFALANPDPEINYELAVSTRKDLLIATGRSDHPNQVNNALGFPYIFRGALDVRASSINEEMKRAAVHALAELARKPAPEIVSRAYPRHNLVFSKEYFVPKALDPRLITTIAPAVAKAAMESGVARMEIYDWEHYGRTLKKRIGMDSRLMTHVLTHVKEKKKKILFADGENVKVIKAAQNLQDEKLGIPVLLGDERNIRETMSRLHLDAHKCEIIDPVRSAKKRRTFAERFFDLRKEKGVTMHSAQGLMYSPNYFGMMMLEDGQVDTLLAGVGSDYVGTLLPALQVIGKKEGVKRVCSINVLKNGKGVYFLADTDVNLSPSAEELVDIVGLSAKVVRMFGFDPRVAMLSYSNFGANRKGAIPQKMQQAVKLAKARYPDLVIDGDIQPNVASSTELLREIYPFSQLAKNSANTFIFPDIASGNIAYKLLSTVGGMESLGPILLGMRKPVHVLQQGSSEHVIFDMAVIALSSITETTP